MINVLNNHKAEIQEILKIESKQEQQMKLVKRLQELFSGPMEKLGFTGPMGAHSPGPVATHAML